MLHCLDNCIDGGAKTSTVVPWRAGGPTLGGFDSGQPVASQQTASSIPSDRRRRTAFAAGQGIDLLLPVDMDFWPIFDVIGRSDNGRWCDSLDRRSRMGPATRRH